MTVKRVFRFPGSGSNVLTGFCWKQRPSVEDIFKFTATVGGKSFKQVGFVVFLPHTAEIVRMKYVLVVTQNIKLVKNFKKFSI